MKIIVIIFLLALKLFAQDLSRVDPVKSVAIYPQSVPVYNFNTAGFNNITNARISELPFANPACITIIKQPASGVQFSYGSKINNAVFSDVDMQPANQWLPVSAVFVYPVFGVPFALGFQKRYSENIEFGELELTTVEQPDGTGETIKLENSTEVYSYSAMSGYSFNSLFSETDHLAVGLQLMLDQISLDEKIGKSNATINDFSFSFKAGLIYGFSKLVSFGLHYEKNFKKDGDVNYNSDSELLDISDPDMGNNETIFANLDYTYPYYFKFPDKISLGTDFTPLNFLNLNIKLTYTFWNQVVDNLNNNLDFSISSAYFFNNGIGITLGALTSNYNFKKTNYYTNNRDAVFLTSGIKVPLFQQSIHLQILDSHLFSDDTRKQTILRVGFDYTFK